MTHRHMLHELFLIGFYLSFVKMYLNDKFLQWQTLRDKLTNVGQEKSKCVVLDTIWGAHFYEINLHDLHCLSYHTFITKKNFTERKKHLTKL